MENKSKPQGPNNKKPKMIRFNLYWMYSLIAFVLIGLYYMNGDSNSKEVTWSEFEEVARDNGIKQIVVYTNKDYLEAYIKDSTAQKVFKTTADKIGKNPKIFTNIPSADAFDKTGSMQLSSMTKAVISRICFSHFCRLSYYLHFGFS